jgi:hypothetical protein
MISALELCLHVVRGILSISELDMNDVLNLVLASSIDERKESCVNEVIFN